MQSFDIFKSQPTTTQTMRLFMGIIIFAVTKSKISKIDFPPIVRFFKTPKDNETGIDKIATSKNIIIEALWREIL